MSMSCLSSPRRSCALKLLSTQRPQSSITCFRYVSLSERSFSLLCTCSSMVHRVRSYATVALQCHPDLQTWLCNVLSVCTVQLTGQYTLHLDNWFTWSISLCYAGHTRTGVRTDQCAHSRSHHKAEQCLSCLGAGSHALRTHVCQC